MRTSLLDDMPILHHEDAVCFPDGRKPMCDVVQAAKAAHAHSFIKRLPNGYDTIVSEDGGNISQGQKQLLCIARIMLTHTRMQSASRMVESRCATMKLVRPCIMAVNAFWMRASVRVSMLLVASSRIITRRYA